MPPCTRGSVSISSLDHTEASAEQEKCGHALQFGRIPVLPSVLVAAAAGILASDGAEAAKAVVDLTAAAGTSGFDCPMPGTEDVYATATCTCEAGSSVGRCRLTLSNPC